MRGTLERVFLSLLNRCQVLLEEAAARKREDSFRRSFKRIGLGVEIGGARFSSCSRISIGDHVYISESANLVGRGGIDVQDHVIIAPEVVVLSSLHNWKAAAWVPYDNVELLKPVVIGTASWIGYRAILLPGVRLGEGTIVGAGAVVTKSFPCGSILAGNPAKPISQRDMVHFKECCAKGLFYLKTKRERKLGLYEKDEHWCMP